MIEVLIDHSYADDYFMISNVTVNIDDAVEKERIKKAVKKHLIVGSLVSPDRTLKEDIAQALSVDQKLIDMDTSEIDLM